MVDPLEMLLMIRQSRQRIIQQLVEHKLDQKARTCLSIIYQNDSMIRKLSLLKFYVKLFIKRPVRSFLNYWRADFSKGVC